MTLHEPVANPNSVNGANSLTLDVTQSPANKKKHDLLVAALVGQLVTLIQEFLTVVNNNYVEILKLAQEERENNQTDINQHKGTLGEQITGTAVPAAAAPVSTSPAGK